MTVPAIWQEDARRRMRQAVKVAGILEHRHAGETTLSLVAEPEAAAMAVLDDFRGRKDVEVGLKISTLQQTLTLSSLEMYSLFATPEVELW